MYRKGLAFYFAVICSVCASGLNPSPAGGQTPELDLEAINKRVYVRKQEQPSVALRQFVRQYSRYADERVVVDGEPVPEETVKRMFAFVPPRILENGQVIPGEELYGTLPCKGGVLAVSSHAVYLIGYNPLRRATGGRAVDFRRLAEWDPKSFVEQYEFYYIFPLAELDRLKMEMFEPEGYTNTGVSWLRITTPERRELVLTEYDPVRFFELALRSLRNPQAAEPDSGAQGE